MHKTQSVSLAGMVFSLNDNAYKKLEDYLNSIKLYFSKNPDKEEIIDDIEHSIAEKFSQKSTSPKHVITLEDVNSIIAEMGDTKDFSDTTDEKSVTPTIDDTHAESKKKLFRDTDHQVIAGVCAGIAAYFGIDVVIVRLLFALSIFTPLSGALIPLYLILWLAMPKAKTSVDKMQMHGKPITLSGIEKTVKERFHELQQEESMWTKILLFPFRVFAGLLPLFGAIAQVILNITAVLLLPIAIVLLIANTISFGTLSFFPQSPYIQFPFDNFPSTPVEYTIVGITYTLVVMLLAFVIILSISLLKRKYILNAVGTITFVTVWIVLFSIVATLAIGAAPQLQNKWKNIPQHTRNYTISPFNKIDIGGAYKVTVIPGTEQKVQLIGPVTEVNAINVISKNNTLYLERNIPFRVCLICFHDDVEVRITTPSLEQINLSGATDSSMNGFTLEKLEVHLSGASYLNMKDLTIKNLYLGSSGSSDMYLEGSVEQFEARLSGSSYLEAFGLVTQKADIHASGSSDIEITVNETLKADLSGSSDLHYKGTAKVTSTVSGSSEVIKVGEESQEE